ncbi:Ubiquitin domain-containing protein 2 [Paramecium bursaria]
MGVCGVKHTQAQSVNEVPQNQRILRLYQQYQQVFQITHHLNVNHKYSSYITLIPDKFVGTGIKRTNLYTTKLSKEEWNDKRKEFWESRLESEAPFWHAIRQAVEEKEESQSLIILANADLKLINNSLQLLYNSQGQKFDVPVFMINEPQQFPTVKFCDANIIQNFNEGSFQVTKLSYNKKVKIRSSKFPTDISIEIETKDSIVVLKQKVQEIAKVGTCRLFLSGRELHDHHQVGNYSISNGTIIQAFM